MIRRSFVAGMAVAMAHPVLAFDQMQTADCRASFDAFTAYVMPDAPERPAMTASVTATSDGWCLIQAGAPGFETEDFETFAWRSEETSRLTEQGIPPLAIELRVTGLSPEDMQGAGPERPDLRVDATLRQIPEAGQILIERAVLQNDIGDSIAVSALFERVFLTSPSMVQVSLGSATFKSGLFTMSLEGTHDNPFGFGVDVDIDGTADGQRRAAFETINALPDGMVDDASRAELMAYAGDLPAPVGTLELQIDSERGLGVMQVLGSAMQSFASLDGTFDKGATFEILFDGLTVTADWTPAAQLAD